MKKMLIVLSLLITVSHLYADEKSAFQWQPSKNYLKFVNKNPNIMFLDTDVNISFDAFILLDESDWHKSFKNIANNENKSNNTVAIQNEMDWLGFGIAVTTMITGEILLRNYYSTAQPEMYKQFDTEWKKQQEQEKLYQLMTRARKP